MTCPGMGFGAAIQANRMMVPAPGQRRVLSKSYLLDNHAYRGIVCTTWNSTLKGSPNDFAPKSVRCCCAGILSGGTVNFHSKRSCSALHPWHDRKCESQVQRRTVPADYNGGRPSHVPRCRSG